MVQTMEYYSDIERNEVRIHATTWINLRSIMLSKISQTLKDKHCTMPLIPEVPRLGKVIETESRTEVSRGRKERGWGVIACRVSVWGDENLLEMDSGETT